MYHSIELNCIGCGACVKVCPVDAIKGERKELHIIDGALCIDCGSCGRVCPKGAVRGGDGRIIGRVKRQDWVRPRIDAGKCYACENCVASCPVGALAMKSEELPLGENLAVLAFPEKCVSCGWCFDNCQFSAISMEVPCEVN